MDDYIAVVFDNEAKAFAGLHALWKLDTDRVITCHGAVVIRRDADGHAIITAKKHTRPGVRTAVGIGIGALLGLLAGPIGAVAGASIALGTATGIGAAAGGVVGLVADSEKAGELEEAEIEANVVMNVGQAAVIAEVTGDSMEPVDAMMKTLGGVVYRRDKGSLQDMMRHGSDGTDRIPDLYPYDYDP